MNNIYLPKSATEYLQNEFQDQITIMDVQSDKNTIKIQFNREIHELDFTNIFFAGAHWGIHLNTKNNDNEHS